MYKYQTANGRYLLYGNPASATSWEVESIRELEKYKDVMKAAFDLFEYGLTTSVKGKKLLAKNPRHFHPSHGKLRQGSQDDTQDIMNMECSWKEGRKGQNNILMTVADRCARV